MLILAWVSAIAAVITFLIGATVVIASIVEIVKLIKAHREGR